MKTSQLRRYDAKAAKNFFLWRNICAGLDLACRGRIILGPVWVSLRVDRARRHRPRLNWCCCCHSYFT
jgi:hypothetical protein